MGILPVGEVLLEVGAGWLAVNFQEGVVQGSSVGEAGFKGQGFQCVARCVLLVEVDEMFDPVFVHPLVEVLAEFDVDEIGAVMWCDVQRFGEVVQPESRVQKRLFLFHEVEE